MKQYLQRPVSLMLRITIRRKNGETIPCVRLELRRKNISQTEASKSLIDTAFVSNGKTSVFKRAVRLVSLLSVILSREPILKVIRHLSFVENALRITNLLYKEPLV